jgi:salicylate hydroxylase
MVAYPIQQGRLVNVAAYLSDLHREGTVYDGPSFVDITKDDVVSIFDKWEEEVGVIVQVISFVQLNNPRFLSWIFFFFRF